MFTSLKLYQDNHTQLLDVCQWLVTHVIGVIDIFKKPSFRSGFICKALLEYFYSLSHQASRLKGHLTCAVPVQYQYPIIGV